MFLISAAYNNLEETYKKTRENEEALQAHTTETEQMLDQSIEKSNVYQKENEEMKEKITRLTHTVLELENEKEKVIPTEILLNQMYVYVPIKFD